MKILVTGGGGFLGSHIINQLLEKDYQVAQISRSAYPDLEEKGVEVLRADISDWKQLNQELTKTEKIDAIIHTAALAGVWGRWDDYFRPNVIGTKNLIRWAKENQVQRFVYTSSPSVVLGNRDIKWGDENLDYPKEHLAFYPKSKMLAEKEVLKENDSEAFCSVALRPHLIWGPGDHHIFPRIIQRARKGQLKIIGDGHNKVDVIHVHNAAKAHIQALEKLQPSSVVCGKAYFLGQEKPVELWEFINTVLEYNGIDRLKKKISYKTAFRIGEGFEFAYKLISKYKGEPPMTRFMAHNLSKNHYFSHEAAARDFGYKPEITVEQGLKELYLN